MNKPILLIYGMNENEKRLAFQNLSEQFNCDLIYTDTLQLKEKIGFLLDMDGFEKCSEHGELSVPDIDFVLLHNIPSTDHVSLFTYMRENGIATGYKAVLTDTNKNWSLAHLINENFEEHKIITLWQKLRQATVYAEKILLEVDDWELSEALKKSAPFVSPKEELPYDELLEVYNELVARLKTHFIVE
ncbi:MAG: DUF3783 domain-containing protein [Tissierellia bacterium]|nr:DUF3783 domain-containing protein [Tissierellia bacterium]